MIIFDTESDGLVYSKGDDPPATRFHIMGWTTDGENYQTTTDTDLMQEVLSKHDMAVCHNSFRHDFPLLDKLLGFKYKGLKVDTLFLSWTLFPREPKHGLEYWGERFGYPKVEVDPDQWRNPDMSLMKERVIRDVEINWKLWERGEQILEALYESNQEAIRFLHYLQFKGECAAYQEANPIRFDKDRAERNVKELEALQAEKVEQLIEVMPKVSVITKKNKPKVTHKKDGTLSAHGDRWFRLLRDQRLPMSFNGAVEVVTGYVDANPNSTDQVKSWLEGLGWKPCTYKYVRDADGSERKIPQVRKNGELTQSVLRLIDKTPEVEILEGLTVAQHRLGVFKGFLDSCMQTPTGEYRLQATIAGLTNTLRFKHKKPLVNLPGVDKPYGEEIRACLIADPNEYMVGADMVSLESTTKRHYIYPHDPEYAEEMSKEGFDEHLDLAMRDGVITKEDYEFYTSTPAMENDPRWKMVHSTRKTYKPVNYASIYGIRATKLSRELGKSKAEAAKLLEAYWERNWAVKKVAEEQYVKEVNGYLWLKNPVSGFYYELRFDKDRFSTLNQGTGVYLFDSWLARAKVLGYMGQGQFHDETLAGDVTDKQHTQEVLKRAIEKLNKDLNLNVRLDVDVKFGKDYSEVH